MVWIVAGLCALLLGMGQQNARAICVGQAGLEDLPCDFASVEPIRLGEKDAA
jgi:hypothetical protein